jgi:hypothetical protein
VPLARIYAPASFETGSRNQFYYSDLLILPRAGVIYYSPRLGHFALLFCFGRQKMKPQVVARRSRHNSALLLAAAAALLPRASALATTDIWKETGTADWNTAGHWSSDQIPQNGDTVIVGVSNSITFTVTYDYTGAAATLATLALNINNTGGGIATITMGADTLTSIVEEVGDSASSTNGEGTFNQSGGTNQAGFGGTGDVDDQGLFLGVNPTDKGFYILTGGTLTATGNTPEYIGASGIGVFNQSGGLNTIDGGGVPLDIGENPGATGTYILSNGTLAVQGVENLGQSGSAIFNQSGGTNTVTSGNGYNQLDLGAYPGATCSYTLSGGSVSVSGTSGADEYISAESSSYFNQTGGTNTVGNGNSGLLNIGGTIVGEGITGSYSLSGGALIVNGNVNVVGIATSNDGTTERR